MKTRTFSPADVCTLLLISKSTLLRWEREGLIPKPERTSRLAANDQRMYSLRNLATIARKKHKSMQSINNMDDRALEICYRVQFFYDSKNAVSNLESLATKHMLSDDTLRIMADEAFYRSRSDAIRKSLLKLLVLNG